MDTSDVLSLVEDLGSNIDDLEDSLAPLLKTALSASTSKLPLLDKAKLYVLATYAIESILFSALRLNGVDAKAHQVFQELSRVKEYFGKIKTAETAGTKKSTAVDREAAGRFIKHGLAGNDKYDRERAERAVREKAGAKRKLGDMQGIGTHTRFDGAAKRIKAAEDNEAASSADNDGDGAGKEKYEPELVSSQISAGNTQKLDKKAAKRQRREDGMLAGATSSASSPNTAPVDAGDAEDGDAATSKAGSEKRSKKAPRSHSETFQALLQGPLSSTEEKGSKKKKRKSKGQGAAGA
ncbi:hypothetical protein LTR36_005505 [Oleoguttula mirabilis]|uniref:Exosome complex protein n=1 Tax=Oleoguttula mirabilis TaxID=1507867 RepID=A0AAV9JDJ4_9PEZI|nr:hypothetical protein LTR36_005505 [Oleoguttula mirabilis]